MALNPLHDTSNNQGTKVRYCYFIMFHSFNVLCEKPKSENLTNYPVPMVSLLCLPLWFGLVKWGNHKTRKPKTGNGKPETGNGKPETGNPNPEFENQYPEFGIRNPESGIRNPESGIRNPQIKENNFFKFAKIILHSFCL